MLMHAFTDGLAAVAGLAGFVLLSRHRGDHMAQFAAIGFLIFGLAASIGTVKFLFGLHDMLDGWHMGVTRLGVVAGMGCIGIAFAGAAWPEFTHRLPLFPVVGALIALHVIGQALGLYDLLALIVPGAAVLTGIAAGIAMMRQRDVARGLGSILFSVTFLALGFLPAMFLSEDMAFHVFHVGSALLFAGMIRYFQTG